MLCVPAFQRICLFRALLKKIMVEAVYEQAFDRGVQNHKNATQRGDECLKKPDLLVMILLKLNPRQTL